MKPKCIFLLSILILAASCKSEKNHTTINKNVENSGGNKEVIEEGSFFFNDQVLTFKYKPRKDDKVKMGSDMLLLKKDVKPNTNSSLYLSSVVQPGRQWPYGSIPFILDLKSLEKIGFYRSNLIPRITAWNYNPYTNEDTGIFLHEVILVEQAVEEGKEFQEKHITFKGEKFSYFVRYLTKEQLEGSSYIVVDGHGATQCGSNKIFGIGTVYNTPCAHLGRIKGQKSGIFLSDAAHISGVVEHEVGHAIGFIHEHNRPDRDEHLDIKWSELPEDFKLNFIINSTLSVDLLSPYDYNSVMHYESGSGHLLIDWHNLINFARHIPINSDEDSMFFAQNSRPGYTRKDNGKRITLADIGKISKGDYLGLKNLMEKINQNYPPNSHFEVTVEQSNVEDNLELIDLESKIDDGFFQYSIVKKLAEERETVLIGFSGQKTIPIAMPKGEYEIHVRSCRESFEYIDYRSPDLDECLEKNQSFEECGERFQSFYQSISVCGDVKTFDLSFSDSHPEMEKVQSYLRIEELKLLLRYIAIDGIGTYLEKTGCNVNNEGLEKSLEKIMNIVNRNEIPLPFNVVKAAFYTGPNAYNLKAFSLKPRLPWKKPKLKGNVSSPPPIKTKPWSLGKKSSQAVDTAVVTAAVAGIIWLAIGVDTGLFIKYSNEPVSRGVCADENLEDADKWLDSYLMSIKDDFSLLNDKGCEALGFTNSSLLQNQCSP